MTTLSLLLALGSLRRHKLRSALTMLGIAVGIASVIVIVAVGDGAARLVETQVRSLGSNLLLILPPARSVGGLTPADAEAIRWEVPGVKAVSPVVEGSGHMVAGDRNWAPGAIKGEGEEYLQVKAWELAFGEFFTGDDVDAARRVCVLGETVREALFGDDEALGASVRIGAVPFQVVGVLRPRGSDAGGDDPDDVVIAPWTTVRRTLQGSRFDAVDLLLVSSVDERSIPYVAREVAALLRDRHPDQEFRILSMMDVARLAAASSGVLTRFLAVVASISLVVGGVGITNIMLVSVAERRTEIGVRMAVGARRVDILAQFLGEGILTALIAGFLGIALGVAVAVAIGWMWSRPITLSPTAAGVAVLASGGVGLLFGAWPSVQAGRLDPIRALRAE